jgi:hypothetical protein
MIMLFGSVTRALAYVKFFRFFVQFLIVTELCAGELECVRAPDFTVCNILKRDLKDPPFGRNFV